MTLQLNDISLRFNYFTLRFQSLHRDAPFRSEISKTISSFLQVTNFVSSYCSAIRYVSSIILSHTWRVQWVYAKIYLFLATKNWKELCFRSFLCVRHLHGQVEHKMETQVAVPTILLLCDWKRIFFCHNTSTQISGWKFMDLSLTHGFSRRLPGTSPTLYIF